MFTEKDIEQVIEIYETRGIVTRDDFWQHGFETFIRRSV